MPRIYLDNAATSWPKPESVYLAVDHYQRHLGVAAGRGGYRTAEDVSQIISRCRNAISTMINATHPAEIIFTHHCTEALNLAIQGILGPGDAVVASEADHNSILRPLRQLEPTGVQVSLVPLDSNGMIDLTALRQQLTQRPTRLIACTHVSNVTGTRQPVEAIAAMAREFECLFLLDAAQSLGHEPIDVQALQIDMLAAPGHKGLLGPLGTGFLFVREDLHPRVSPLQQGGTGTQSELETQPESSPEKFESGNLNVPGIAGLLAGLDYLNQNGLGQGGQKQDDAAIENALTVLTQRIISKLQSLNGVAVYSRPNRYGIVSFNVASLDPRELAVTMDSLAEIQVRAGFHCAPRMHQAIGTYDTGGCARASLGHFSNVTEADKLIEVVETIVAAPMA